MRRLPFVQGAVVLCGLLALGACGDAEAPEVIEEYGAFRGTVVDGEMVAGAWRLCPCVGEPPVCAAPIP